MTTVDPFKIVEQGKFIFPADPNDKRPVKVGTGENGEDYRMRWSKHMSNDPAQVAKWVAEFPGCVWGLPTGHVNGFIVVDQDSDEAEAWWESRWLPPGKDAHSKSGHLHIFYGLEDEGLDIQTNKGKVYKDIDIRGEGGYVIAYMDDFSDIPPLPQSVIELLPERQHYTTEEIPDVEQPTELTEQEKRVLKSITDKLDALPRPWRKGASWHDVQFRAACFLNRIANSPHYITNYDQAYQLFRDHAPINENYKPDAALREERWKSAVQATEGQFAEAPGDVPVRLEASDLIDRFANQNKKIDTLFWESTKIGQVKELIRELRLSGATEQEAYSISYEAAAMREIRRRDPQSTASTWGHVVKEYENPVEEQADDGWGDPAPKKERAPMPVALLSEDERTIIRDYPNFIDRYIETAKVMFAEPNMPLHYLNAWIALSCGIADRGRIHLSGKKVPLSLWGLPTADSAAGKGDALSVMESVISGMRRGGFGEVNLGYDTSAQGLNNQLMERDGKVALILVDEASSMLLGFKNEHSYFHALKTLALKLYDGRATRSVRTGTTKDEAGESADVTFNLWLMTTWDQVSNIMDITDVQSGLVGRFLVAIGDDAKITDESLSLQFASDYQVTLGRHPLVESLTKPIRDWSASQGKTVHAIHVASPEVNARFVQARKDVLKLTEAHPLATHLRGVLLRVTENFFKGAALIALSEGRSRVEMEDLLIALKSGEYWVRDAMRLIEAISSSEYRRLVESVVDMVRYKPRTHAQLLASPALKNMKRFEAEEAIDRAEREGLIKREENKWTAVE